MTRTRTMLLLSLLASLALVAAACGGAASDGGDGGENGGTLELGGEPANDHGATDVAGESSIEFELDDNYFEPTVLEGEAGQTITLKAFSEGDAPHTFTVDGTDIDEELAPGDRTEIEVTFPESGALIFHCHFHDAQGMRGALSVGGSLDPSNEEHEGSGGHGGSDEQEEEDEGKY